MLKISIVTVCYNMNRFIEQTICSILDQKYENLEYIIIDGGSTDGTLEIINKYRDHLSYFVSEPDKGMYDALSKGFTKATGDIFAWLNADDVYFPWTLRTVNDIFSTFDDISWINGKAAYLSENGNLLDIRPKCSSRTRKEIASGWSRDDVLGILQQENMFWRASLYKQAGGINACLHFAGDFELWKKFAQFAELARVDLPLAAYRTRNDCLSFKNVNAYRKEMREISANEKTYPNVLWFFSRKSFFIKHMLRMLHLRKTTLIYYEKTNSNKLMKKRILTSASNFSLPLLPIYSSKPPRI